MCVSGNKHEHRGETCVSVCDRDRKWKGERVTCHHRRGIQHAIMVILVTIWALQKVSDRVSAITRVRLQGEVERERRGQPAISLRSPVSPSQWILKASLFQEKSWLPWFLFSLYLFQTCNVKGIKKKKKKSPSLLSALNFTPSTLSQSMCTLLVYTRAHCLNVTTRSFDACCIHNSASSSPPRPPFLSFLLIFSKYLT